MSKIKMTHRIKRTLAALLCIMLTVGNTNVTALALETTDPEEESLVGDSWQCGDDLYAEYDNGVLTLTGTGNMKNYSESNTFYPPWFNYNVYKSITSIHVADGVTGIGAEAFANCSNLTEVILPADMINIGDHAFYNCNKLSSITVRDSSLNDIIPEGSTGAIILPDCIETIGEDAFLNCTSINDVYFFREDYSFYEFDSVDNVNDFSGYNQTKLHIPITVPREALTEEEGMAIYAWSSIAPENDSVVQSDIPIEGYHKVTLEEYDNDLGTVSIQGLYETGTSTKGAAAVDSTITVNTSASEGHYAIVEASYYVKSRKYPITLTSDNEGNYSFTMPDGDVEITVTFLADNQHTVTIEHDWIEMIFTESEYASTGATVSLSIPEEYVYSNGSPVVKDDDGNYYDVTSLGNGSYTFLMPDKPVSVSFEQFVNLYVDSNMVNGTVSIENAPVLPGETVELTPVADEGYELGYLTVNDERLEANEEGKFTFVTSYTVYDYTISAVFKEVGQGDFNICYDYYAEDATVDGPAWADAEETVTFTVTPREGFGISDIYVHGTESMNYYSYDSEADGKFSFTMPSENVKIHVYTDELFSITINKTEGGTVTADHETSTPYNKIVLSITPDKGYALDKLLMDESEISPDDEGVYSFRMPDDDVTVSAEWRLVEPICRTHALTLGDQIGVIFYMELPADIGTDYADSYMRFTVMGKDGEETVPYADSTLNGDETYQGFTCNVSSIQMADTITAEFCYTVDGTEKSVTSTYSVKEYVDDFMEVADSYENCVPLVKALADFGHYAQLYFSDYKGWTIGEEHTEMPAYNVKNGYSEDEIQNIISALSEKGIVKEVKDDIAKVSFATDLDSKTAIKLYFKPTGDCEAGVSATVNGDTADVVTKGGRYVVTIPDIKAHELGDKNTVVLTTSQGESRVEVRAMSYALAALRTSSKETMKNLMAAFYEYYEEAVRYTQE